MPHSTPWRRRRTRLGDPDAYLRGRRDGRAAGGGKPPSGCRRGLLALPLRLLLLPVTVLLAKRDDRSGPLGGRRDNPKHKGGEWTYDRDRGGHPERKHTRDIPDDEVDGEELGGRK